MCYGYIHKDFNIVDKGPDSVDPKWNQFLTQLRKDPNFKNRAKKCFLCNKAKQFCNSHTIPHFVLENIAENGKLKNTQVFNNKFLISDENGLNKAQTFRIICTECDGKLFQEYETKENYTQKPSQSMLKQIALKNHLSRLYKHTQEKIMACNALDEMKNMNDVQKLWLSSHKKFFEQQRIVAIKGMTYNEVEAKTIYSSLNNSDKIYDICYFKILDYKVPYTLQGHSCIFYGFNEEQLTYPFVASPNKIKDLHVCIFPFSNKSIILIFCKKDFDKYFRFFEKLKSHNNEKQLSIINYLCFAYFEDIFLNNTQSGNINNNQALKEVSMAQSTALTFYNGNVSKKMMLKEQIKQLKTIFSIDKHLKIPNLLSQKFEVK